MLRVALQNNKKYFEHSWKRPALFVHYVKGISSGNKRAEQLGQARCVWGLGLLTVVG